MGKTGSRLENYQFRQHSSKTEKKAKREKQKEFYDAMAMRDAKYSD
jgi:hypothetical protein